MTEGDKIIVSRISPIEDQGGYGLALNYGMFCPLICNLLQLQITHDCTITGSLVARVLFQPLEESSRLFYSREMGNLRTESNEKTDEQQRNHKSPAEKSVTLLQQLLKFQIYLTLIFVCFCPFYTTPLLYHLLRGSRWMSTSAPRLLQEYLFLLPLLGFNGILEAFVQATASEEQLGRMSKALLVWSGIYCACCYIAVTVLGMKEDALILANAITMACRIAYSVGFINRLCHKLGASFSIGAIVWQTKLPIVASLLTTPVLRWSKSHFHWSEVQGMLLHIGVGGLCFLVCAAAG